MNEVSSWIQGSGFEFIILVTAVILIERWLPWPDKFHPLSLFQLVALNMGKKVNPRKPRSAMQRKISGSLAVTILVLPSLAILALLLYLADYPVLINAFLLLIALRFKPTIEAFNKIEKALKQDKKNLARHHLDNLVLRETQTLSPMGIAKAAVESLLVRFGYQTFAVIFWYMLAGGVGALAMRMCYELSQMWNTKITHNVEFGKPAAAISRVLSIIPMLVFIAVFMLVQGFWRAIDAYKRNISVFSYNLAVRALLGGAMGFQLSGPAIYAGQKYRFKRVGGEREIRFVDMQRSRSAIQRCLLLLLVFIFLYSAIRFALIKS